MVIIIVIIVFIIHIIFFLLLILFNKCIGLKPHYMLKVPKHAIVFYMEQFVSYFRQRRLSTHQICQYIMVNRVYHS